MKTIKILGGGISGLSAGINLAKAGFNIEVYETNKDTGERFHGDLQGIENWSAKENVMDFLKKINIEVNFNCHAFNKIGLSNGHSINYLVLDKPIFYLVKRGPMIGTLDQGLKLQALECGCKIHYNQTIDTDKADIIATGPVGHKPLIAAEGVVFNTNLPDMAIGLASKEITPGGYGYLLIINGYACLCVCLADLSKDLSLYFEKTKNYFENEFKFQVQNSKKVGGIGFFSINNTYQKNMQLYIGESAGIQDYLWGFGMKTALYSGYLAAKSIIMNQNYSKNAKKAFDNHLKASVVNRKSWETFLASGTRVNVKNSKNIFPYLQSIYNFNIAQRFIYPFCKKPKE